ncbi:MAG: MlaD family protein [Nitrospirota bacterium]
MLREEIKAGIIIFASLAILSVFIILIGGGRFFEKFDKYYVRVMNASGLETGAQVKLGGVRIGRVLSIKEPVGPGEPVTIEIGVKKGTLVYKGTKALITQIGFVGDIYLLLTVSNTTSEKIMVGDDIPSEESVEFSLILSRLDKLSNSLDGLISDIDRLFSEKNAKGIETLIGNTNQAIVSSSSNLEKVAAGLKSTTDKLEIVLNEIEELVRGNKGEITQLIKKAREDLDRAGDMINSIEKAAKSVDRTVDIQSQNLDNLLNTMTRTTEDLQEVLQEIKNKPWSLIYREGQKKGE